MNLAYERLIRAQREYEALPEHEKEQRRREREAEEARAEQAQRIRMKLPKVI